MAKKKTAKTDWKKLLTNKKVLLFTALAIAVIGVIGYATFAAGTYTQQKGIQDISIGCASTPQTTSSYSATCVKQIQYSLNYICRNTDIAVDGGFGPKTKYRIAQFQHDAGLVTDGKVGSNTWNNLATWRYKHATNSKGCTAIINYP